MTTDRVGRVALLLRRGAGPAVIGALLLAACSSSTDVTADTTVDDEISSTALGSSATTVPAASADPTTTAAEPADSVELADAPGLLAAALTAIAGGYHFVSTVTVGDGTVALVAEGDRVGAGTRMTATSNGASVDYVLTPDGSWANSDGTWQELTDPAPIADPIAALQAPEALTVTGFDGTTATLVATYPGTALGLADPAPVEVVLTIVGGQLQSLGYGAVGADGVATTVTTAVSPLLDASPVTIPL